MGRVPRQASSSIDPYKSRVGPLSANPSLLPNSSHGEPSLCFLMIDPVKHLAALDLDWMTADKAIREIQRMTERIYPDRSAAYCAELLAVIRMLAGIAGRRML